MAKKKNARQKAWYAFSRYIRHRDCLLTTGGTDYGICCTCGNTFPFERLQAGHFIPGRNNAILFDTRGVNAQCVGCNMYANGRQPKYHEWMIDHHGQEVIDELFHRARKSAQFKPYHYEDFIQTFKAWDNTILSGSLPDEEVFLEELQEIIGG
jgi:hypothetical protein